ETTPTQNPKASAKREAMEYASEDGSPDLFDPNELEEDEGDFVKEDSKKPDHDDEDDDLFDDDEWDEDDDDLTLVAVPEKHVQHWLKFEAERTRIMGAATPFHDRVYIVGGTDVSFEANVDWDDIVLPTKLKDALLNDVDSFFATGVDVYRRLNLKPFRKLLFAGVPGTGKTMLCSAIARRALDNGHFVIYVSGSNMHGSEFWKIHQALDIAARADTPTIVLVEELDAYLNSDSKAQMLNVLDGSETPINAHGTLLIATTNHPERIDNRVMKRPGRLDRIFIIPELQSRDDAERMLKNYLGAAWQDDHSKIVPALIGKPGAFIREVAVYALTMAAYQHSEDLTLEVLQNSLDSLEEQIEVKDNFLTSHKKRDMGLTPTRENGRTG
ncbi:MAG: AAA family ATPase, partial [Aggregatilineales bacterium]